ncbi:hypothetical protein ILYODFUR_029200 [Ilyodon furcidens]|uniref:VWFC domain-containing protein n=1 Tax=Ilyodon furcidens TaxID=33524 RepID=A0ABV0VAG2_9TELE
MASTTAHSSASLFSTRKAPISSSVLLTTPTTIGSTATQDCYDVYPPKQNGESWKISNCTTATCTGGKITVSPTVCPNVTQPICANRRKPVKIYEQNGCCFHYECEYCVGPDGKPKQPGEIWTSECNTCECDQDSMSVRCEPVKCPEVQNPNCTESGQQLLNKTQGCCPTQTCECNFNQCAPPPICPLGFKLNITNGTCCQSYKCVPKGVCVYDTTEFKVRKPKKLLK